MQDDPLPPWLPRLSVQGGPRFLRRHCRYSGAGFATGVVNATDATGVTGSETVNAIRISLGSIKDRARLQAGLQRLSDRLAQAPRRSTLPWFSGPATPIFSESTLPALCSTLLAGS